MKTRFGLAVAIGILLAGCASANQQAATDQGSMKCAMMADNHKAGMMDKNRQMAGHKESGCPMMKGGMKEKPSPPAPTDEEHKKHHPD